eukprot:superscaffoldBa00000570_g5712
MQYKPCKKHHFGIDKPEKLAQSPDESKFLMKTLSQIKSNVGVPIKKKVKENKEKERLERRLLDELYKIFMDSDSFYYSMTYDLTNSVQRQGDSEKTSLPLWKQVDDRFFWNKHMIQDLINLQVKENKEKERLERRLLDELYKMFMDSDSCYYSMTYDL